MPSNDNNDYGRIVLGAGRSQIPAKKSGALAIHNPTGNGTLYLGDSAVTTATGFPIPAGTSISVDVTSANLFYIIGTATNEIAWMVY